MDSPEKTALTTMNHVVNFNINDPDKTLLDNIKSKSGLFKIETALRHFAYGDIKKVSTGDNVLASFILCSCFIEQMATFRYGREVGKNEFESFTKEYLSQYDAVKLREDLRNKLVHNYSLGESYSLVRGYPQFHLQIHGGSTVINIENFVEELGKALDTFMLQLRTDQAIMANAVKVLEKINIVSISEIEINHGN